MALPLVPFLIGAAAGAAATYLYKDKEVREDLLYTSLYFLSKLKPQRKTEEVSKTDVSKANKANVTADSNINKSVH